MDFEHVGDFTFPRKLITINRLTDVTLLHPIRKSASTPYIRTLNYISTPS